jgi:hypothetical protein
MITETNGLNIRLLLWLHRGFNVRCVPSSDYLEDHND